MDLETYQLKLKDRQIEKTWIEDIVTKGGSCLVCGFNEEPRIIEKHHVGGKINSPFTVPVCPNCHQQLTMTQEPLKEERTKPEKKESHVLAYVLEGISNLLTMVARILRIWSQRILVGVIL